MTKFYDHTDYPAPASRGTSEALRAEFQKVEQGFDHVSTDIDSINAQLDSGKFSALSLGNNLTFTGTGQRIAGDFSNATTANRVMFQTSTPNGNTELVIIPNGAASTAGLLMFNNGADLSNTAFLRSYLNTSAVVFEAGRVGAYSFLPMIFYTGGSERVRITTSGNVGFGTNNPLAQAHIFNSTTSGQSTAALTDAGGRGGMLRLSDNNNVAGSGGAILFSNMQGDAANSVGFAAIKGLLSDGSGNTSGGIAFSTRQNVGDAALTERMRIDANGNVTVNTNTGGLGYGTGAGGAVTQATSKSTAVTLNKPTGRITMHNASLAAGALVVFTVNNSIVTVDDIIVITGYFGAVSPTNYEISAKYPLSGGFVVYVKNISGGALSEAVQFNFAIIRGATS